MSKETDQALVMISVIAGCFETYKQTRAFARVDIKAVINTGFIACCEAIKKWPGMSNRYWTQDKQQKFTKFILEHPDRGYTNVVLACMCERLITDLHEREKHSIEKRKLIFPIAVDSRVIHDFCDREGLNFDAYEKADELLDELYRLIEFEA